MFLHLVLLAVKGISKEEEGKLCYWRLGKEDKGCLLSAEERKFTDSSKLCCRERETKTIILSTCRDGMYDSSRLWQETDSFSSCIGYRWSVFWHCLEEWVVSHFLKTSYKKKNTNTSTVQKVCVGTKEIKKVKRLSKFKYCSFVLRPPSSVLQSNRLNEGWKCDKRV